MRNTEGKNDADFFFLIIVNKNLNGQETETKLKLEKRISELLTRSRSSHYSPYYIKVAIAIVHSNGIQYLQSYCAMFFI